MPMIVAATLWIILVNAWTAERFHADKVRAIAGRRRIPERELLRLAMIGGSPGAFVARRMFRHKTRKEPFSTHLQLIAAVQAGVGGALLFM